MTDHGETIPTNLRVLLVLEEVAKAGVPVMPSEVNRTLGLPKPTIHRLFTTLELEGFLQRDLDGKSFGPGRRAQQMAGGVLSSLRIRTARQAILRHLSGQIGETCNIATADGDAMVYVERVDTEWPLRIQLPIGSRVPLSCTASGKMYLSSLPPRHIERYLAHGELPLKTGRSLTDPEALRSELERIHSQAFAVDNEEFLDGMIAVAVPIRDANERLFATLSFHAPVQRFDLDRATGFLPDLRRAAIEIAGLGMAE